MCLCATTEENLTTSFIVAPRNSNNSYPVKRETCNNHAALRGLKGEVNTAERQVTILAVTRNPQLLVSKGLKLLCPELFGELTLPDSCPTQSTVPYTQEQSMMPTVQSVLLSEADGDITKEIA